MSWFYVENETRKGPVSPEDLIALKASGAIHDGTLVWQEGMADWIPFSASGIAAANTIDGQHNCAVCGESFPASEMVKVGDQWVAAKHKELYLQSLREGRSITYKAMRYAGFWIRFGAYLIDYVIVTILNFALSIVTVGPAFAMGAEQDPEAFSMTMVLLYYGLTFGLSIFYYVFFVGKYAATPGKMACGLKIVRSDGGRVSYLRAFGRMLASILSGLILLIGYIMAAFDEEKRTLHDRICDTRVIRK